MARPRREDARQHIARVVEAVLRAADAEACVRKWHAAHVERKEQAGRAAVLAIGKAAAGMYRGWCVAAGEPARRLMVVPAGVDAPEWAVRGEHPLPGTGSLTAGEAVRRFVRECGEAAECDGLVLLLSGGASALVCSPIAGVELPAYRRLIEELMRAGADIHELNAVRKHLEMLKGGRLAAIAWPRPVVALVLSDVIGDDLSVIGSGPVTADSNTFAEALAVVRRWGIAAAAGIEQVLERGARGEIEETPKPGDPRLARASAEIVGSNRLAVAAAAAALEECGFVVVESRGEVSGEAAEAGRALAERVRGLKTGEAVVWGGETTVTVGKARGRGGRNQELALSAALALEGCDGVVAAVASDGVDGVTDAAGAFGTGGLREAAQRAGIDAAARLADHDSHAVFAGLEGRGSAGGGSAGEGGMAGGLIVTGPTGTNVNDVAIGVRYG